MEKRIKDRYNDDILCEARERYGIAPERIRLLDGFESFMFEFERDDGEYILRVGHSLRRSIPMIQGKVNWINWVPHGF
jgi:amicoumacin kinase